MVTVARLLQLLGMAIAPLAMVGIVYFSLFLLEVMTGQQLLILLTAFILIFPLWFFRYARAFWIAFDEKFDPWPNEQEAREMAKAKQSEQG